MAKYLCGTVIKYLRESKRLTQRELCDLLCGLCSVSHLSRIERGEHTIEMNTFNVIMEKLGENPRKYYTVMETKEENRLRVLKEEADELTIFERYEEAEKIIDLLEFEFAKQHKSERDKFKIDLDKQCIMSFRAMISMGKEKAPEGILSYLTDAIKITIKEFEATKISDYFLTIQEIKLINLIAVIYGSMDRLIEAVMMLSDLKINIDKNYNDELEKSRIYQLVLYNLSKYQGLLKRYNEALATCDAAINCALKYNQMRKIPNFMYNKAYCLFHIGDKRTSREFIIRAYYMFLGYNDFKTAEFVKDQAYKNFNFEITY